MRPADVRKKDEPELFTKMFGEEVAKSRKHKGKALAQGDMVRVSKLKGAFEKGYVPNWSQEHFIIDKVNPRTKRRVYKLRDYENEEITGILYEDELQPIKKNLYLIEKVLRKRKTPQGTNELFIKWKGWPAKFNSWINETEINEKLKAK